MQDFNIKFEQLNDTLGGRVKAGEMLAPYTTFKIGGPAAMFFTAENNDDLVSAVVTARYLKIPFFIISGGSNVLIDDRGLDRLVIQIKTSEIIVKHPFIIADAGVQLADLVKTSIENGMKGLVWASGIPGDVGGAIRGNAGAYGGEIKDNLHSVEILRGGKQFILERKQIDFGYRDSMFKHNSDIILTAKFELITGNDKKLLQQQSQEIIDIRNKKHPHTPTAGSFFKNIPITSENEEMFKKLGVPEQFLEYKKVPTGWLLDKLEMRGTQIGQAVISQEHANIITNLGGATANDVLALAEIMKSNVREKFGINIESEVQIIRWP